MMRRVMIVGGSGSGKSTLARALGARTGLPVFYMDQIHYQPGWVERSREEKDRLTREVHQLDAWIFEGGHSRTYPERIERADTLVWLDVPVALRLWRILRRWAVYHGRTRPDMPPGCTERVALDLVAYVLRTRRRHRARHAAMWRNPPDHVRAYRLRTAGEARRFLDDVAASGGRHPGDGSRAAARGATP